jgi:transcriptional regulator with XRE-family HTH domain
MTLMSSPNETKSARTTPRAKLNDPSNDNSRRPTDRGHVLITPTQARTARKLLKWSKIDVAVRLDVSKRAIAVFERQERLPSEVDLTKLKRIFEAAGIEFTSGEPGVKLKAKPASATGRRRKKMPDNDRSATSAYHILHSANHSRKRAEELRTLAEVVDDPAAKRLILSTAEDYERLAERAEERAGRGPTSSPATSCTA